MVKKKDDQFTCSFCGKTREKVKKLIAGPKVYICNECIDLCHSILEESEVRAIEKDGFAHRYYLFDIKMNSGQSFSSVRSIGTTQLVCELHPMLPVNHS